MANLKLNEDGTVVVKTEQDIFEAIKSFIPSDVNDVISDTTTRIVIDGVVRKLVAKTGLSNRGMMIEGFDIVKSRIEAAEKYESGIPLFGNCEKTKIFNIEGKMWLDDLITRCLGGKRDGLRVRWDLAEGVYFFEPYTGKISKNKKQ